MRSCYVHKSWYSFQPAALQKDVRATFCFTLQSYSFHPCFHFANTYRTANLNQVLCRLLGEQDELGTVPDHKEFKSSISCRPLRGQPRVLYLLTCASEGRSTAGWDSQLPPHSPRVPLCPLFPTTQRVEQLARLCNLSHQEQPHPLSW